MLYFAYFNSKSKENNTIDSDYLSAWVTIEAEKEISSIDDLFLSILVVIHVFG